MTNFKIDPEVDRAAIRRAINAARRSSTLSAPIPEALTERELQLIEIAVGVALKAAKEADAALIEALRREGRI